MKRKEAKKLYEQYLYLLQEADMMEQQGGFAESVETLRDSALDIEREIEDAGYAMGEFR